MRELIRAVYLISTADHTLNGCSMDIRCGEALWIMGTASSGKETLAGIISGRCASYCGKIYVDEQKVPPYSEKQARQYGIYFVDRQAQLLTNASILENLSILHTKDHGIFLHQEALFTQTADMLAQWEIPYSPKENAGAMTGYYQSVLSIAEYVNQGARLLILPDIPVLSESDFSHFQFMLDKLREAGISVLLTASLPKRFSAAADRVLLLHNGVDRCVINTNHPELWERLWQAGAYTPFPEGIASVAGNQSLQNKIAAKDGIYGICGMTRAEGEPLRKFLQRCMSLCWENGFLCGQTIPLKKLSDNRLFSDGVLFLPKESFTGLFYEWSCGANLCVPHRLPRFLRRLQPCTENSRSKLFEKALSIKLIGDGCLSEQSALVQTLTAICRFDDVPVHFLILESPARQLDDREVFLLKQYLLRRIKTETLRVMILDNDFEQCGRLCDQIIIHSESDEEHRVQKNTI